MNTGDFPDNCCLDFFQSGYRGFGWEQPASSAEESQQKGQKVGQTIIDRTHQSPLGLGLLQGRCVKQADVQEHMNDQGSSQTSSFSFSFK